MNPERNGTARGQVPSGLLGQGTGDGLCVCAQWEVLLVPGGGHVGEEFGRGALRVAWVAGQQPVGGEGDVGGRGGVLLAVDGAVADGQREGVLVAGAGERGERLSMFGPRGGCT